MVGEFIGKHPNERVPVDNFAVLLGHPPGTKLVGKERVAVRLALGSIARKIANRKGISRKLPRGGPVFKATRHEMFLEVLAQIRKNPLVEPDITHFHGKYAEKIFPGEKYRLFSTLFSELKLVAKRRILRENPKMVFWDSNGKTKKRRNSFYVRAGADKKIEALLSKNPHASLNVDEFAQMLGHPKGATLEGTERIRVQIALNDMARRIAREKGLKRKVPKGGTRPRKY